MKVNTRFRFAAALFLSATMSVSSDPPPHSFFAGLSTEQLIAEEQEHQATRLLTHSILGKRTSPSGSIESDNEGNRESPSPGDEDSSSHPSSVTHPNPASLQMDQVIRRMAKRLKLSNESISLVEQFAQVHVPKPQLEHMTDKVVAGALVGGATGTFVRQHHCNWE